MIRIPMITIFRRQGLKAPQRHLYKPYTVSDRTQFFHVKCSTHCCFFCKCNFDVFIWIKIVLMYDNNKRPNTKTDTDWSYGRRTNVVDPEGILNWGSIMRRPLRLNKRSDNHCAVFGRGRAKGRMGRDIGWRSATHSVAQCEGCSCWWFIKTRTHFEDMRHTSRHNMLLSKTPVVNNCKGLHRGVCVVNNSIKFNPLC